MPEVRGPRVLATGFGPFPGAPENPTVALVASLGAIAPDALGAAAFRAVVLPTEYRRSWRRLRRLYDTYFPDVVVHFGLSRGADCLKIETAAARRVHPDLADAAGYARRSALAWRSGPEALAATLPAGALLSALGCAGFPAQPSEDAGGYVCNATFYRTLRHAAAGRHMLTGFVHVPAEGRGGYTRDRLLDAAQLILRTAAEVWATRPLLSGERAPGPQPALT